MNSAMIVVFVIFGISLLDILHNYRNNRKEKKFDKWRKTIKAGDNVLYVPFDINKHEYMEHRVVITRILEDDSVMAIKNGHGYIWIHDKKFIYPLH